jgi:hypothetical protein
MLKKSINILLIILPVLGLLAAACDDDSTSVSRSVNNTDFVATESFEYLFEVDQHTRLSLDAVNGTISVTGIPDADSIIIGGEKKVGSESLEDAQDYLQFLEVSVEDQITNVDVTTEQPANTYGRSFIVDYDIQVPDGFYVSVNAVNGLISIEAVDNNLNIQNINGQILLDEIAGSVVATLSNGQITGDINMPSNGSIRLSISNGPRQHFGAVFRLRGQRHHQYQQPGSAERGDHQQPGYRDIG